MLLIKRGNIDEVFIHKDNFYGEKSIFASCKKNDSIHTEKSYSYVLKIALVLSVFYRYAKQEQIKRKLGDNW